MRQIAVVVLALLLAMVTAKSLDRDTKLLERALLSRLINSRSGGNECPQDDCVIFSILNDVLSCYYPDWTITDEQTTALLTLFPNYEGQWVSCYGDQQEGEEETFTEEIFEESTEAPEQSEETNESSPSTTPPTEPTTSPTEPLPSRRFRLDKLLRDLQLKLKRREGFKRPNHKRRK